MAKIFNDETINSFYAGTLYDAYEYFGCHTFDDGARFTVWAPNAKSVRVSGDFNGWNDSADFLHNDRGIWSTYIKGVSEYQAYKFVIETADGRLIKKADPYAFHGETRGASASKIYGLKDFSFSDDKWLSTKIDAYHSAMSVYEVHLGSWRKYADGSNFSYRKFADEIVPYLIKTGFTHVEFMGIAEYPYDGSWGYQVTGYFAPTSRYGVPEDLAYLINKLHENNIGVILDWVPGHFPKDEQGLYEFDGTCLYEPYDELRREQRSWGTRCFDYAKGGVTSFLISNALYWFDRFHVDGLRVDAVASMLYLDYDRTEWRPNQYGGKENLDAVEFFRHLNSIVFSKYPNALMIAEESTAWPMVTKPAYMGGLGFNFKWNMGWMNDTLSYVKTDPLFRMHDHYKMTFSMVYAFSENYVLPISHDEVVHGKGSLLNKMPGSYEQKFAGFRNYLMYMFAHPGKKLLIMGSEFGQFSEWNYQKELDWNLLDFPAHAGALEFTSTLNKFYRSHKALYAHDDEWQGFEWLVYNDNTQNVYVFERKCETERVVCVLNFSPIERNGYTFGVDEGEYVVKLYSDVNGFNTNEVVYTSNNIPAHSKQNSLTMNIPSFGGIYLVCSTNKKSANKKTIVKKSSSKATVYKANAISSSADKQKVEDKKSSPSGKKKKATIESKDKTVANKKTKSIKGEE